MTKATNDGAANLPIVLRSPSRDGFTFFRRINPDLTIERKSLGGEWEPNDPPTLVMPLDKYLYHMTNRVKWVIEGGAK